MTKPLALATLLETDGKLKSGTFNLGMSNLVTGTPSVGDTVRYAQTGSPAEYFNAVGGSPMVIGGNVSQETASGQSYESILNGNNVFAVKLTSSDPAWDSLPDLSAYNEQTVTVNYLDLNGVARTLDAKIIDDSSLFMVPGASSRKIIFYDSNGGNTVGYAFQGPDGIDQVVQIYGPASGNWGFSSNSSDTSGLITSATIDSTINSVIGTAGSPITATHDTLAELESFVSGISGDIASAFPEFYAPSGRVYSKVFDMGEILQNVTHSLIQIGSGHAFRFDDRATGGTSNIAPSSISVSRNGVRQIESSKSTHGSNSPNWTSAHDYQIGKIVPASAGGTPTPITITYFDGMQGSDVTTSILASTLSVGGSMENLMNVHGMGMYTLDNMGQPMSNPPLFDIYTGMGLDPLGNLNGQQFSVNPRVQDGMGNDKMGWPTDLTFVLEIVDASYHSINGAEISVNFISSTNASYDLTAWRGQQGFDTVYWDNYSQYLSSGSTPASFSSESSQDGSVGDIYFPNGLNVHDRLVIRSF
tara:strand:- start:728 stop:2317 length:1590 start_codon:yes stop_codon:yes gene_type:complete